MKILALDQGTTSSRSLLVSETGAIAGKAQREFTQHFPQPGWVEHDAEEIWESQWATICEVLEGCSEKPAAIGITNQRETTVLWERATGKPIGPAIVWQDRRTSAVCAELKASGAEAMVRERTGLVLDPYFSGTKIAWMLDHIDGARARAEKGELAFGTVDAWLLWKLTGRHAIEASNASRTLLFNLETLDWDGALLELLRVPRAVLPEVVPSSGVIAEATLGPVKGIPVAGMAGDQQAALFGQACFSPGRVKNTYGTGCFMLMNVGEHPVASENELLTTLAWQIDGVAEYALEGSVFIGGAVVQWLRDGLGIIESAGEIEALAGSVPDTGGVVLVPAFAGLGAPHWEPEVRGTITGITRGTTRAHFARAALEAIAFQSAELLDCMKADAAGAGSELSELRVDGGATANGLLMQIQADVLGVSVVRPKVLETTALGAAFLAGLGVGVWDSREAVSAAWEEDARWEPKADSGDSGLDRAAWERAVSAAKVGAGISSGA